MVRLKYNNVMNSCLKKSLILLAVLIITPVPAFAQGEICAVYFTGVGCPHCAKTDPVLLGEALRTHDKVVVIEYEIYQQQVNSQFLYFYDQTYGSGLGVPLLIFGPDESLVGDIPILGALEGSLASRKDAGNPCPLLDGQAEFGEMNISAIPGLPNIWTNGRILMRIGAGTIPSDILRNFLTADNPAEAALDAEEAGIIVENITASPVPLSGSQITFEQAVRLSVPVQGVP